MTLESSYHPDRSAALQPCLEKTGAFPRFIIATGVCMCTVVAWPSTSRKKRQADAVSADPVMVLIRKQPNKNRRDKLPSSARQAYRPRMEWAMTLRQVPSSSPHFLPPPLTFGRWRILAAATALAHGPPRASVGACGRQTSHLCGSSSRNSSFARILFAPSWCFANARLDQLGGCGRFCLHLALRWGVAVGAAVAVEPSRVFATGATSTLGHADRSAPCLEAVNW